ncbi:hypothetical protein D9M68_730870 [compost metagenome]
MLQLRPNCECCARDLPADSAEALICSFECTFCRDCSDKILHGSCPNCGGELVRRPIRPAAKLEATRPDSPRRNTMTAENAVRPPLPPFTRESAIEKVRLAEDGWNSRDPQRVSLAYTLDTKWRNRTEFALNRQEAKDFLTRKWAKELDYRLIKELWAFSDNRIAVRYAYEWHDDSGNWFRSYGNENWEFDENGLMANRFACINDMPIKESERKFHWPLGRRPDDHPGLAELGL